jgi:hypothetical protein
MAVGFEEEDRVRGGCLVNITRKLSTDVFWKGRQMHSELQTMYYSYVKFPACCCVTKTFVTRRGRSLCFAICCPNDGEAEAKVAEPQEELLD